MKCQIETISHKNCKPEDACIADPAAVIGDHRSRVVITRCNNERVPGEEYCEQCLKVFLPAMAARNKALEDEAAKAAAEAAEAAAIAEASNENVEQ